jgi:AcrR family transcriptional regulator
VSKIDEGTATSLEKRLRIYIQGVMAKSIPRSGGRSPGSAKRKQSPDDGTSPPPHAEKARRGRGRPKLSSDEQQASAIARQARDLFVENGYARTSMEEIAARRHISKRTLYRLFPNKAEVFGAIVDDHRQSMLALPGDYDDLSLEEAIGRIFLVDIDEETHRKRIEVLRLVIVEGRQFPELTALLHEHGGDKSLTMLTQWLEAQARRGRIDIEDAATTAKMLMDVMFGAIAMQGAEGLQSPGGDNWRLHLRRSIRIFVNGVRRR